MKQIYQNIISLMVLLIPIFANANKYRQELLLQTDKTVYASGELLSLKCTPILNELIENEVLFVDICGEGYLINKSILRLTKGSWQGSLMLNDSIQTGIYLLRAYTGSSEGDVHIETQPLTIINRFGYQQINEYRKKQPGYKAFNPLTNFQGNLGTELGINTSAASVKTKDTIEIKLSTEAIHYRGGIALSVFKTDSLYTPQTIIKHQNKLPWQENKIKVYDRLYLSGSISDSLGKALANKQLFLSFPDSIAQINYTFSDEKGNFRFNINQLEGSKKAIIQLAKTAKKVQISCSDNHLPPPPVIPLFLSEQSMKREIVQLAAKRVAIKLAYAELLEKNKNKESVVFRLPFYGLAQKRIHPSDYFPMENFEELARELLPNVKYRIRNKQYELQLWDPIDKNAYNQPLILVDGVVLNDPASLDKLNSSSIRWIDLQARDRCYGLLRFSGLIAIQSRNGDFSDIKLPENAAEYNIQGYSNARMDRLAQLLFSDVLHWEPQLQTNNNELCIKVKTSLETGFYVAIAQAINNLGEIQRAVYYFNVE